MLGEPEIFLHPAEVVPARAQGDEDPEAEANPGPDRATRLLNDDLTIFLFALWLGTNRWLYYRRIIDDKQHQAQRRLSPGGGEDREDPPGAQQNRPLLPQIS